MTASPKQRAIWRRATSTYRDSTLPLRPYPRHPNGFTVLPIFDRLSGQIEQGLTCQLWTGSKTTFGYGQISYEGKVWQAHRLVYSLFVGPIPQGKVIMHSCDTPACVSLEHLRLGTYRENSEDASRKGRFAHRIPWNKGHLGVRDTERDRDTDTPIK